MGDTRDTRTACVIRGALVNYRGALVNYRGYLEIFEVLARLKIRHFAI